MGGAADSEVYAIIISGYVADSEIVVFDVVRSGAVPVRAYSCVSGARMVCNRYVAEGVSP